MKTTMDTVNSLINIESYIYDDFQVYCRPYGYKYICMVLRMAQEITRTLDLEDITQEVRDILTNENYHMINHAIDSVMNIDKYSYRDMEKTRFKPDIHGCKPIEYK